MKCLTSNMLTCRMFEEEILPIVEWAKSDTWAERPCCSSIIATSDHIHRATCKTVTDQLEWIVVGHLGLQSWEAPPSTGNSAPVV